jgi:hypothetical protein
MQIPRRGADRYMHTYRISVQLKAERTARTTTAGTAAMAMVFSLHPGHNHLAGTIALEYLPPLISKGKQYP